MIDKIGGSTFNPGVVLSDRHFFTPYLAKCMYLRDPKNIVFFRKIVTEEVLGGIAR